MMSLADEVKDYDRREAEERRVKEEQKQEEERQKQEGIEFALRTTAERLGVRALLNEARDEFWEKGVVKENMVKDHNETYLYFVLLSRRYHIVFYPGYDGYWSHDDFHEGREDFYSVEEDFIGITISFSWDGKIEIKSSPPGLEKNSDAAALRAFIVQYFAQWLNESGRVERLSKAEAEKRADKDNRGLGSGKENKRPFLGVLIIVGIIVLIFLCFAMQNRFI